MIKEFIRCGTIGWGLENLWTGLNSLLMHDPTLKSRSSLIMFPIYGMAFLIKPVSKLLKHWNFILRGLCYAAGIISTEYITGIFLKRIHACPWDYSKAKLNYKGVIRLDFIPLWFIVGLLYEKALTKSAS